MSIGSKLFKWWGTWQTSGQIYETQNITEEDLIISLGLEKIWYLIGVSLVKFGFFLGKIR